MSEQTRVGSATFQFSPALQPAQGILLRTKRKQTIKKDNSC